MKELIKSVINTIRLNNLKDIGIRERISRYKPYINIEDQYTNTPITPFLSLKLTNLHAFQIGLVEEFVLTNRRCFKDELFIIDFGDSSGNHIQSIKKSLPNEILKTISSVSVNCDPVAVEKITNKKMLAWQMDICKLQYTSVPKNNKANIGICFETLEHLNNPLDFISELGRFVDSFIFTVPYTTKSRVGFHHLKGKNAGINREDLHIFELCPKDWKLIFKHFGWKPIKEEIYYQYPKNSVLSPLYKMIWEYIDFGGFYGAILRKVV